MVFFLVLDILWFIVCVAGVIFTLLIWLLYSIFVTSSLAEAKCSMKDADTCYCERTGEADVKFESKCDHFINNSVAGVEIRVVELALRRICRSPQIL